MSTIEIARVKAGDGGAVEVAVMRLRAGRGNAMSVALLGDLAAAAGEIRAGTARAVVVTGDGGFFSAGLALPALIELDRDRMREFIRGFDALMARGSRSAGRSSRQSTATRSPVDACWPCKPTCGSWPKARSRSGSTRSSSGSACRRSCSRPCGRGPATLLPVALRGRVLSPHEALHHGLVHEVVPRHRLETRAIDEARRLGELPAEALPRSRPRSGGRSCRVAEVDAEETERWLDTWFSDAARVRLRRGRPPASLSRNCRPLPDRDVDPRGTAC